MDGSAQFAANVSCVDGEVFEGDFEIVFVAFLRPTYLPFVLAELNVGQSST